MINVLGMHGSMWIFSGCCLFGMLFNLMFVPETKGKSIQDILEILEDVKIPVVKDQIKSIE